MQAAMPDVPEVPDMPAGGEFVEGWLVAQLLGEGAYGEVRLLVHARSGACVALKVSRGAEGGAGAGGAGDAAREAALHRALRHPHVLRCLGARAQPPAHYTFLEYAAGGDLFDRIEPDVGMPELAARRYFAQLLSALRYLHERGVAHRDVKPENLLLDRKDDLKLSDFGLATLFRHGARERLLSRVCGTLPYAAPEVLGAASRPYRAPPADLWAGAVVLVAMLSGELPWERALPSDARFTVWARGSECEGHASPASEAGPWRKIRGAARALLRRALRPEPARRATLPQLQHHRWLEPDEPDGERSARLCRSQPPPPPAALAPPTAPAAHLSAAHMDALISYSQPSRAADLLLAGAASQDATQTDAWARLGARLTRVRVAGTRPAALERAADALRAAGLCARIDRGTLVVECGGEEVRMRAWAVPESRVAAGTGGDSTLLEFRRARGCGLRFQRLFREARRALRPLAPAPTAPAAPTPPEPMDEA